MKYIHPFPARMAPEILLGRLENFPKDSLILDPMCGSGMVLHECSKLGIKSIGTDIDPLALMISRASSTTINFKKLIYLRDQLIELLNVIEPISLKWIDNDKETMDFVNYWFAEKQIGQLKLFAQIFEKQVKCIETDILKIALSRLIITKTPKASLASDTSHSRPHKTIKKNDYDVVSEFHRSFDYVYKLLKTFSFQNNAVIKKADAMKLKFLKEESIDAVITSPPYLNAIDYIRGHKFSLVWLGYKISELRNVRSNNIGAEKKYNFSFHDFGSLLDKLNLTDIDPKTKGLISRYYTDLQNQLTETHRVLKTNCCAIYVIGNSNLYGKYIENSKIIQHAAQNLGFEIINEQIRSIPENKRYLPIGKTAGKEFSKRMRTEHILELKKI